MKKITLFGCLLLGVIVIISALSMVISSEASNITIYVDDNASSEWYDDTHVRTIQDAIDNANDGDTVYVYSGIYYENIVVDKSITLIGEDKTTTIIDGNEITYTIGLFTDGVHLSGFTIQNAGSGEEIKRKDVTLYVRSDENTISDNIFICGPEPISDMDNRGIFLFNSSNNHISRNIIEKNFYNGILLHNSHYNDIIDNVIIGLTRGLRGSATAIGVEDSSNNIIKRNEISKNNIGIFLSENNNITSDNQIIQNNFIRNLRFAVVFNEVGYIKESRRNIFDENYWSKPRLLPKPLIGRKDLFILEELYNFPIAFLFMKFDLHPSQEPYDISSEEEL
jgi:parallel beta-helix repeat protein